MITTGTRLLLIGDSTTYGRGASTGSLGVVGAHIDSPCRQLSRAFNGLGVTSGSNSVVGMGSNSSATPTQGYYESTPDVSVTLNGWNRLAFDSIGGDIFDSSVASGGILTFSFDNVDTVAIGIPIRTYGTIQYKIDGGAWVQVNEDGGGVDDLLRIELDLVTLGVHTVEFQSFSGTVYLNYVEAWDSSHDIVIVPWGARGYTSLQMNDAARPWSYRTALEEVPFDAAVLNIGINDISAGTSQIDYETNVTIYVNAIKTANPDAIIFLQIPNDISAGLSFIPASLTSLSNSLEVNLLDSREAINMGTYNIANSAGNMYDSLHPSNTGYFSVWNYFAPIIIEKIENLSSVFTMTDTGISDGLYSFDFYNHDTKKIIETRDVTFSGGGQTISLPVAVGVNVFAYNPGSNPPVTGMAYDGVTI
tara:strand:+ start:4126 stop:5382 length:1257 start_codon:yes stop_codon:yes gene_type:complete